MPAKTAKKPRFSKDDVEYLRSLVAGDWIQHYVNFGGANPDLFDGQHHACPKCGGTNRWRMIDVAAGAILCNQCFREGNGDGFAGLMWFTGKPFLEVIQYLANFYGISPSGNGSSNPKNKKPATKQPDEDLESQPWNEATEMLVQVWCTWKPPITLDAIKAVGGRVARYSKRYNVIALPVWGENIIGFLSQEIGKQGSSTGDLGQKIGNSGEIIGCTPVGWVLYNLTGGELPRFAKNKETGQWEVTEWLKVKLAAGSEPGIIADLSRLPTARIALKTEGPSDLLAALSTPDLPADVAVVTNANGAGERLAEWMLRLISGRQELTNQPDELITEENRLIREQVWVAHDADRPGEQGAIGHKDERSGDFRPGCANNLAALCTTKNLRLPFPMAETHGKDLRDFFALPATFSDLQAIADATEPVAAEQAIPAAPEPQVVLEHEDDPHYLARANIDHYQHASGGVIKFWREQFYIWKPTRACYRAIHKEELMAKVTGSVKREFDRQWAEAYERYREWQKSANYDADADKGPPKARKVTANLVANVINAMKSLCLLPSSVELNTWLDGESREQRPYVAMLNGIIDIEKCMLDTDPDEFLLPHSPNWFSTVRLPYAFDPEAICPRWEAFLEKSLEQDPERIKILQEWAGYCLTPDTSHQKFLAMEGEGGNGKSVFMAGLQAILGADNCEHVGLERLVGGEFDAGETFGKLANFCADVGEIDKLCEGNLKSFTSGDMMSFKRKFLGNLKARPTARLILSFNNRPRFSDRSQGVWRRMLLIPWRIQIAAADRVLGMDSATWWEKTGELSGMFLWALQGLYRLRNQRRFTSSQLVDEAIEDYQDESNPARSFLKEHFEESTNTVVKSSQIYHFYVRWAESTGHRPMNERTLGKEIRRVFPKSEHKKLGSRDSRFWAYAGINFSVDRILGEKTSDLDLLPD